jgi:CheY-like chemotaxis protein
MATILLVDDNDTFRKAIQRKLKRLNHKVLEAADGLEAIKVLESVKVDVIVSDVQMPNCDGIRFYEWVLENTPEMASHFLFHSGAVSLLDENEKVKYVPRIDKPFMGDIETVIRPYLQAAA